MAMLDFFRKNNKDLDFIIKRIESNMANNYKDNAQSAFRDFENAMSEMTLSEKQREMYSARLEEYRKKLEGYTHKDQQPYWH